MLRQCSWNTAVRETASTLIVPRFLPVSAILTVCTKFWSACRKMSHCNLLDLLPCVSYCRVCQLMTMIWFMTSLCQTLIILQTIATTIYLHHLWLWMEFFLFLFECCKYWNVFGVWRWGKFWKLSFICAVMCRYMMPAGCAEYRMIVEYVYPVENRTK